MKLRRVMLLGREGSEGVMVAVVIFFSRTLFFSQKKNGYRKNSGESQPRKAPQYYDSEIHPNRSNHMSWTDVYPVLTDEQLSDYERLATCEDRLELDEWCGIARRINGRPARHRVAVSLFWKNLDADEAELGVTGREQMQNAEELGLISRHAPWQHYVEPLLKGADLLREVRPEVAMRVYLAADLDFLIDDLVELDCEVMLMRSASLRHNPGALWRFLALEAADEWITVIDADRGAEVLADVERTEQTMAAGLGLWRVPYAFDRGRHERDPSQHWDEGPRE
jgi:hypothetical protein